MGGGVSLNKFSYMYNILQDTEQSALATKECFIHCTFFFFKSAV